MKSSMKMPKGMAKEMKPVEAPAPKAKAPAKKKPITSVQEIRDTRKKKFGY